MTGVHRCCRANQDGCAGPATDYAGDDARAKHLGALGTDPAVDACLLPRGCLPVGNQELPESLTSKSVGKTRCFLNLVKS